MNVYLKLISLIILSGLLQYLSILFFRKKKAYQHIYELSPERHQNKQETPSLGGIGILISLWASLFLFNPTIEVFWLLAVFTSFASIGFIDDIQSLLNKKNKGLSARRKFFMQIMIATLSLQSFSILFTPLSLPEYIFYGFMMVGFSNATNLTDGLDGLLAGTSIITLSGFIYVLMSAETHIPILSFLLSCIMILIGFLIFNSHPAKIFMGDTGSLPLGALFSAIALLLGNIWLLLPLGAVYIIETASVIIQVAVYKRTKKRVFLMSPLHHHFECCGFKETTIVMLFYGIAMLFTLFL